MKEFNDIYSGWKDNSDKHNENATILEKWFNEYYEQVCRDAIMHDDADSVELLEKLDLHFETIRFFSKAGNHERVVKELDSLVQMLKPWLE